MFNLTPLFMAFELNSSNVAAITFGIVALYIIGRIIWKMWKFPVSFIDSQTKTVIKEKKYRRGAKVKLEPAVKNGENFIGWSFAADGRNMCEGKHVIVKGKTEIYAMWERPIAREVIAVEDANMYVEFAYADENGDIMRKETLPLIVNAPKTYNDYGRFKGWKKGDGEIVVPKHYDGATVSVTLYPVFNKDVGVIEKEEENVNEINSFSVEDANLYLEFTYIDLDGNDITTNLLPVFANVPKTFDGVDGFEGWSFEEKGEIAIEKDYDGSVLAFALVPAGIEKAPVVVEAVEEAPVVEETVEEAPVVEETVEEAPVAEETVEEAPVAEETVEEAPVVEETVEEAPVVEEAVEEAPVVEEAVEEAPVVEETIDEAPVVEETVEETPVVEEKAPEVEPEPVVPAEPVAPTVVPTYFDNEGNHIDIKYSRSFISNIIQGDELIKEYYSDLKNHILSYEGVKSRLSWKFDSYNRGRDQLFKIKVRGKTICIYLALDPDNYEVSKYHHEAIDAKIFEDVPMLFKIKSGLGLRKAKQLVDDTMARFEIAKSEKPKFVDYVKKYPYTETEELVQQKLVKVLVSDSSVTVKSSKKKVDEEVDLVEAPVAETAPVVENVVETPVEEVVESPAFEEVTVNEVAEETPVVEETVEEAPTVEETVEEAPANEEEPEEIKVVESVSADEADAMVKDETVDKTVEADVEYVSKNDTKKAIINVGVISDNYEAGETVDLASLKAKKLIDPKAKSVKVLASGKINKPLTVKAQVFSETAIKMIVLTGGKAIKVVTKVK